MKITQNRANSIMKMDDEGENVRIKQKIKSFYIQIEFFLQLFFIKLQVSFTKLFFDTNISI